MDRALLTDLLTSLYAGNPDAIAVYDCDGRLVACNDIALQLAGFGSLKPIVGTHFSEYVDPKDVERTALREWPALSHRKSKDRQ